MVEEAQPPAGVSYPLTLRGSSYAWWRSLLGVGVALLLYLLMTSAVSSMVIGVGYFIERPDQTPAEYAAAGYRQRWLEATAEITAVLLGEVDRTAALQLVARRAREVSGASLALLMLFDVGAGTLRVELNHSDTSCLPASLTADNNDHRILAVARNLAAEGRMVTVVTKDLPLRLKASIVGLDADEYRNELANDSTWTGFVELEVDSETVDILFAERVVDLVEARDLPCNTGVALVAGAWAGPADERDAAWVERRVEELQPTADERAIDRIGWAPDLRSAFRLSRESGRPVFLFTMDGRFSIGRC